MNHSKLKSSQKFVFRLRRAVNNEEGSNLTETAIGMMVFLAAFFGIIQCAFAIYSYNWVSEAAREGTRWAMVRGASCYHNLGPSFCASSGATPNDVVNYVKGLAYPGLNKSNITVNTNWYTASTTTPRTWSLCTGVGCNQPGNQVQVLVDYQFPMGIPFWKKVSLDMQGTSQMVITQ